MTDIVDAIRDGLGTGEANGARGSPGACWMAGHAARLRARLERYKEDTFYDYRIMQQGLRERSLVEERLKMTDQKKPKPEVENEDAAEPEVTEGLISEKPPPGPGDYLHAEETGGVTIEEVAPPPDTKSSIMASLERTYESKVVEVNTFTSAQKLQDKLNELHRKGFQLMTGPLKDNWLVLTRPHFVWNGRGDVAGQKAAEVEEKSRQADEELGEVLAGTGSAG